MRGGGKKVLVGLSGGVDSAVSLWRLHRQGFETIGVIFKLWRFPCGDVRQDNIFHSGGEIEAAESLCRRLKVPLLIEDVSEQFFEQVVKNFAAEYRRGRTPNPCVLCNPGIKWDNLLVVADGIGADFVATGHYARVFRRPDEGFNLLRGADTAKDQSYFLYRLTQRHLSRTLFPIGHLTKSQTRQIAARYGLPTSSPRESQEICFLPCGNLEEFFRRFIPEATQPGPIYDLSGRRVGTHRGIAFYTIGQREGLGGGFPTKMYVLKILPGENAIVVGPGEYLLRTTFTVADLNWIRRVKFPLRATVRIRHRHKDSPATITKLSGDKVQVEFEAPQRAITPGQSAVFYDGLMVLGGGIIDEVL